MTDYISTWVDPMIGAYIDDLVRVGTHGEDRDHVVRTMIQQGVQRALEGSLIPIRWRGAVEETAEAAPNRSSCSLCHGDPVEVTGAQCAECGTVWEPPF